MREAIRSWKPDLIVREPCEYAALIAAEEASNLYVRIVVLNCEMERKFSVLSSDANDELRNKVGMLSDNGEAVQAEAVFTAFPKSLGETRVASHAPEPFRVVMPAEVVPESDEIADWVPKSQEALVYVTFGTQAGTTDSERAMYRTALDAAAALPIRILLTTRANMADHRLSEIPSNVVVKTVVPQAQVFKYAKTVVTHGSSGTVLGASAAGIPLVVASMLADQSDNARAVEVCGAGVAVFVADAALLKPVIHRVLECDSFWKSARIVAGEMAKMPGIAQAIVNKLESVPNLAPR